MKENDNYKKVEELILNEKTNEIIEEANRAFFDLNNEIYDNMF
ncbi:biliverdin-producing heme oxygenase [bacterium]|nr:biliverdin-producing heme oxygenase [bacterium]